MDTADLDLTYSTRARYKKVVKKPRAEGSKVTDATTVEILDDTKDEDCPKMKENENIGKTEEVSEASSKKEKDAAKDKEEKNDDGVEKNEKHEVKV
ncbi:hypothetical protein L1987_81875 [Smallanthus sonchifolius]|uniref:Uncharacterized protein n=1 Tax=Smallanthus sonchifolius TaxID=185202 RepID=A0ACB8YSS3_9ASTR|nr:hypothetical protein L1987_81875 [Smallanthus sonchifolius]